MRAIPSLVVALALARASIGPPFRRHLSGAVDASASRPGARPKKEIRTGLCAAASPQAKALQRVSLVFPRAGMAGGALPVLSTRRPFFDRFFVGLLTANPLCCLMFSFCTHAIAAEGGLISSAARNVRWLRPLVPTRSLQLTPAPHTVGGPPPPVAKDFAWRNSRGACGL